jgi:hypothetical protein
MIIGISGEINSGKDTVGKMIQGLTSDNITDGEIVDYSLTERIQAVTSYKVKKFAGKLKEIVCLLIGCTREQLEDREFKEKELGEEWWYISKPEIGMLMPYTEDNWAAHGDFEENLVMLTPRKLLQLLGTECGREIIHPNIWINALFADYTNIVKNVKSFEEEPDSTKAYEMGKPKWIITDVRFPNEAQAIKDRGGIVIRVNRPILKDLKDDTVTSMAYALSVQAKQRKKGIYHPSETALDDYEFDHVINNNGSLDELLDKVKQILENEQL